MAELTNKQRLFVEAYLTCWNAAEAARRAGYSERTARSIGAENLTKPDIQQAVAARIAEQTMAADEVLVRLTDHARSSMEDFLDVDRAELDLDKARAAGKLHLVKKFTRSDTKYGKNVSVELYDAQAALQLLGKHHGLFVDRTEVTGKDGQPLPVREVVINLTTHEESVDG